MLVIGRTASADPARVEVILSQESRVYRALYTALQDRLRAAMGDKVQLEARGLPVEASSATLLVSAGIPASEEILKRYPTIPAVAALLPHHAVADLVRRDRQRRAPATALYLDQPPDRYFGLIRATLPEATRVGIIYGSISRADRADFAAAAKRAGLALQEAQFAKDDNIVQVLEPLLSKTDVLLVPPDPEVSSEQNVYPLLLSTYRRGIPVVGFSAAYVRAGALAAVYSDSEQLGQQVADVITRFLQPGQGRLPPPQYPADFRVSVNRQVARSLGLTVPDDAVLYRQLRAREARP